MYILYFLGDICIRHKNVCRNVGVQDFVFGVEILKVVKTTFHLFAIKLLTFNFRLFLTHLRFFQVLTSFSSFLLYLCRFLPFFTHFEAKSEHEKIFFSLSFCSTYSYKTYQQWLKTFLSKTFADTIYLCYLCSRLGERLEVRGKGAVGAYSSPLNFTL